MNYYGLGAHDAGSLLFARDCQLRPRAPAARPPPAALAAAPLGKKRGGGALSLDAPVLGATSYDFLRFPAISYDFLRFPINTPMGSEYVKTMGNMTFKLT